ncbi:aldose 1-epimerase family protein [Saccharomonospora sp. NPDC046836]|uniref:aldose 1-epimerase family protein n=1 Tax=Saccharomonospora sp. NPDC046836 TaxID=3156921 RepID=UPI0033DB3B9A
MNERSWMTGKQVRLRAGDYAATITSLGATLRELTLCGRPLILSFDADELPSSGHGQILAPWPNRLRDGRWTWRGMPMALPVDEPHRGNSANHGLVRWAEWHVGYWDESAAVLNHRLAPQPGYPFALEFDVEYALHAHRGLSVQLSVRNTGATDAPVALGSHPYIRPLGGGPVDDAVLTVPGDRRVLVDDWGTPNATEPVEGTAFDFRTPRRVESVQINNAFTDLSRDPGGHVVASVADADGTVSLRAGEAARWLQVYTSDALDEPSRRRAVAIEPMTAPPGALASGEGLHHLRAGDRLALTWHISAAFG